MRVRLKGINRVRKKLADGTVETYYYAWKGGPRIHGEYGSPEFIANYMEAVASRASGRDRGTEFRSIIRRYEASSEFAKLADSTRRNYIWQLAQIEEAFGDLPVKAFADRRIRQDVREWKAKIALRSERQADLGTAVFARVVSWAYDQALLPANHLDKLGRLYRAKRQAKIWSSEQIAAFYESAPEHLHLPLTLALWTGQRKSDLLALTWSDYDGQRIRLTQRKTGAKVGVPVSDALREALDRRKSELGLPDEQMKSLPILTNQKGQSWSSGFDASWRKACQKAGVTGVTFHDLRGTMVTRLALAGCSTPQIAAISGHSLRDVNEILEAHYLHLDEEMADSAIRQLQLNYPNRAPNRPIETTGPSEKGKDKQWWTH